MPRKIQRILILGASVRAAAVAATELGLEVVAADLFADQDTRDAAAVSLQLNTFDDILSHAVTADAWIYTGGIENCPELVEKLGYLIPLLGNNDRVLRRIRDPFRLTAMYQHAGIEVPEVCRSLAECDGSQRWLKKSFRSIGGLHTHWATTSTLGSEDGYYQQYMDGTPGSLAFLNGKLVGHFEQHIGRPDLPFGYVGNTYPLPLSNQQLAMAEKLGMATEGLVGLFGVDVIVTEDSLLPIEVNPRITASMELAPTGLPYLLTQHLKCFDIEPPRPAVLNHKANATAASKRVAFAEASFEVTRELLSHWQNLALESEVKLADTPLVPQQILAGQPILTVVARRLDRDTAIDSAKEIAGQIGRGKF